MSYFDGKKVLMVMAHPDDELIFGWPILQDASISKTLLICSSDLENPKRKWCSHRRFALEKLCEGLGIHVECLDYDSEFYRLESRAVARKSTMSTLLSRLRRAPRPLKADARGEKLSSMIEDVLARIWRFEFDLVYTHNAWGEYGHLDHHLVHSIVASVGVPTIVSDIFVESNWFPNKRIPPTLKRLYCRKIVQTCENNLEFYERCRKVYVDAGVWTWSEPPVTSCDLYEV